MSLELPLACVSFLEPPSKDAPTSPSRAADSSTLAHDAAKHDTPKPTSDQGVTTSIACAAAEAAAATTASAALVATESSMHQLAALLAAQSVAIARKHALCADGPGALWKAVGTPVSMADSESAGCVTPSKQSETGLLEWSEALLRRCPPRTSCGGSAVHGTHACGGQENSAPVATDQGGVDSADAGKAKPRAARGKAKKGVRFVAWAFHRTTGCSSMCLICHVSEWLC